jgi:hypothetical protein
VEDLLFLDEATFNKAASWRQQDYAAIGRDAESEADISQRDTLSISAAMTLEGYIPDKRLNDLSANHSLSYSAAHALPLLSLSSST